MKRIILSAIAAPLLAGNVLAGETANQPIEITTVRGILGEVQPLEHTEAQLRVGYINLDNSGDTIDPNNDAFAIGGHVHLGTKRWKNLMLGAELYTVQDIYRQNDDPDKITPDFFDADKSGFATLSQAFIDWKWDNTEIKAGRQMIDTPHADSDDIRMMPNYFLAYVITNTDIEGLRLTAAQIDQMAGWDNGIDASRFIDVEKIIGADEKTNGIYLASAVYEGIDNMTLQAWYYGITDIANVLYLELAYELPTDMVTLTFGIQYDIANDTGDKLIGNVDSSTRGISVEATFDDIGLQLLAACDRDNGDTGAFGSFGGGPFFTSLEDQTIDAIGEKGDAWIVGCGYQFEHIGIEGLRAGAVYGRFQADKKENYDTAETDLLAEYEIDDRFTATIAYAMIDDKTDENEDYNQFRLIVNYNF